MPQIAARNWIILYYGKVTYAKRLPAGERALRRAGTHEQLSPGGGVVHLVEVQIRAGFSARVSMEMGGTRHVTTSRVCPAISASFLAGLLEPQGKHTLVNKKREDRRGANASPSDSLNPL